MKISPGSLYFISDQFFQKIQDPYLKVNYETTKRLHYFAITDQETGLYWLVPCSSKIEKFERLIQEKQARHKPADTIKIVKIFDKKTARKVINLLRRGIRFTPTQPDSMHIEKVMLEELPASPTSP